MAVVRRWRVWAFVGAGLLALGVLVPVAWAWVREDDPLPRLPRPERVVGPDEAAPAVVVQFAPNAGTNAVTSLGATVLGDIPGTGFVRVRPGGDAESLVAELREDPSVVAAAVDYPRRKSATLI